MTVRSNSLREKEHHHGIPRRRLAYDLITLLGPLVPQIKRRDRALADTCAASGIALGIAESNYSDPGNRRARLFTAAGSASETRAVLRVTINWPYLARAEAGQPQAVLDRIIRILRTLTHR